MGTLCKRRGAGGAGRVPAQAGPAVRPGRRHRLHEVAKAAGVGVVRIRCYATTWDYLAEQAEAYEARNLGTRPGAFRPATALIAARHRLPGARPLDDSVLASG
ncbi:hypothetical protein ABZ565_16530 [Streptomyces sp. NPDC016469]|uniref:hypothetical protein n=1 Tax=Streptomyces sp. NPDC016469 TaxID=3157191 RepID=UPI0033E5D77C